MPQEKRPREADAVPGQFVYRRAGRILLDGGVIAYPTEAVYGLGCIPEYDFAVERILRMKNRPMSQGLVLVASSIDQLMPYMAPLTPDIMKKLLLGWPGPLTWVVPASAAAPPWITGGRTSVAVRVSAHPVVQALCRSVDHALVSTSANRSGRPPARNRFTALQGFNQQVDLVLAGDTDPQKQPTEIRDALSNTVLRSA
jgi:L-threonylcarbamoyladenylate synthase